MPERGDDTVGWPVGPDRFLASHADRDRVIGVLQAAFVQDRLTKDEFEARMGQALGSRIYADLTALTADLPAGSATAHLPREPARRQAQTPGTTGARSSVRVMSVGTILMAGVWVAAALAGGTGALMVALTFTITYLGTLLLAGAVLLESWHERLRDRLRRYLARWPPADQGPITGLRSGPGCRTVKRRCVPIRTYPPPLRSADFSILPDGPFSSSAMNRTSRGHLYAASRSRQ
jgi:hypothetical protein